MPLRLSYSTINLMHQCERKLQLVKLLKNNYEQEESPIFSFGHSYGDAVVEYLSSGDMDRAVMTAWLKYWPEIEDITDKRSMWLAINTIRNAKEKLDEIRRDFRVADFNGREARELGFRLNINADYYFVGFIDAVLQHRRDGHYAVFECKHTYSNLNDIRPMYENSGQALGYSIVVDKVANQTLGKYSLFYHSAQLGKSSLQPTYHNFEWHKTMLDRLNWFLTLGMDVEWLSKMKAMNLYPMRGHSCLSFNRACPFFGTCGLHAFDQPKDEEEDTNHYDFEYFLDDIVKEHLDVLKAQQGVEEAYKEVMEV